MPHRMDTIVRQGGSAPPSGDTNEVRIRVNSTSGNISYDDNGTSNEVMRTGAYAVGSSLSVTRAAHAGKIGKLDTAAGSTVTLPASTGSGDTYRFCVTVTATSNSHVIKVANATDEFRGFVYQSASEATAPNTWWAADNDDTITLNRTTTGLAAQGEYFEVQDLVAGVWFVRGFSQASGLEATPFSNGVS